jgi:hypothetical protein
MAEMQGLSRIVKRGGLTAAREPLILAPGWTKRRASAPSQIPPQRLPEGPPARTLVARVPWRKVVMRAGKSDVTFAGLEKANGE